MTKLSLAMNIIRETKMDEIEIDFKVAQRPNKIDAVIAKMKILGLEVISNSQVGLGPVTWHEVEFIYKLHEMDKHRRVLDTDMLEKILGISILESVVYHNNPETLQIKLLIGGFTDA